VAIVASIGDITHAEHRRKNWTPLVSGTGDEIYNVKATGLEGAYK